MRDFTAEWAERARLRPARILLAEGDDDRIADAARIANGMGVCRAELLVSSVREELDVPQHLAGAEHPLLEEMVAKYAEARAEGRAPNLKTAARMLAHPVFLAAMLLREGHYDAVVAGAVYPTADVVRAAKYVVGLQDGVPDVSSSFVMLGRKPELGHEGAFVFADCGASIEPDAELLAGIAGSSATTARMLLDCEPRIAMLSFSTRGSASHPRVEKVIRALGILRERFPELLADGELQVDAAIVESVAERKAPGSQLGGRANVLVFPDLNSGNIAYKLMERMAGARAIGPFLQGLKRPVSDLSRGCSTEDVVQTLTVMSVLGG